MFYKKVIIELPKIQLEQNETNVEVLSQEII